MLIANYTNLPPKNSPLQLPAHLLPLTPIFNPYNIIDIRTKLHFCSVEHLVDVRKNYNKGSFGSQNEKE